MLQLKQKCHSFSWLFIFFYNSFVVCMQLPAANLKFACLSVCPSVRKYVPLCTRNVTYKIICKKGVRATLQEPGKLNKHFTTQNRLALGQC